MLTSGTIIRLHDEANERWHRGETRAGEGAAEEMVLAQHRANFELWHEEDEARSPDATATKIVEVKHAIDRLNQRRNDLVERIDRALMVEAKEQNVEAPLHSETPGLMIDRMSILALKIFHTAEETRRDSASEEHRGRNRERLAVLEEQRGDLAGCLDELWGEVVGGTRRFRMYRQMKMYNDPELNPSVYRKAYGTGGE